MESITPFTRKEKYINQIVGGGDTAPKTPQTREELFFAGILGEVVAPSPITRAEKYLAKIANKYSGELPEPVTRIERFLARAAGMDVTIPTPITREEMFWADALIVEKELSGIPPLTFKSNGANLSNYRIYGNTVNGESVGDLVESGEHTGEYRVPVTINSNATSIYLPYQIRKVGDELEHIDYEEQKQHRVRKNLLQNTATSQTINGVTFTVNEDGSVTCNGTADGTASIILGTWTNGGYILSGSPQDGSWNTYMLQIYSISTLSAKYIDVGFGVNILESENYQVRVRIANGYTCDSLTFYPMIRLASIEDGTYEPYIEDTDVDVTLPALPTLSGTNMLSVGTEVQPSNVYIKYEGER